MQGKVIKVDPRGYGFISSHEKKFTRIYFHWSGLKITTINFAEIEVKDEVEFECVEYIDKQGNYKGWRAQNIVVLNKVPANREDGVSFHAVVKESGPTGK